MQNERVCEIYIPQIAKDLVEQIGFEARENVYVDAKSGISARMSITAYENLMSTAEHRCIASNSSKTSIRFVDILGMIPAITGKVELVYEGEQEGASFVAETLIGDAVKTLFLNYFPKIKKLTKTNDGDPYEGILNWFFEETSFELMDDGSEEEYFDSLNRIVPLETLINEYMPNIEPKDLSFIKELVLWSLVEFKKLNKQRIDNGYSFKDQYGSYLSNI